MTITATLATDFKKLIGMVPDRYRKAHHKSDAGVARGSLRNKGRVADPSPEPSYSFKRAWILQPSAAMADAWSTALILVEPE